MIRYPERESGPDTVWDGGLIQPTRTEGAVVQILAGSGWFDWLLADIRSGPTRVPSFHTVCGPEERMECGPDLDPDTAASVIQDQRMFKSC